MRIKKSIIFSTMVLGFLLVNEVKLTEQVNIPTNNKGSKVKKIHPFGLDEAINGSTAECSAIIDVIKICPTIW